jgi:hypothetical protein
MTNAVTMRQPKKYSSQVFPGNWMLATQVRSESDRSLILPPQPRPARNLCAPSHSRSESPK